MEQANIVYVFFYVFVYPSPLHSKTVWKGHFLSKMVFPKKKWDNKDRIFLVVGGRGQGNLFFFGGGVIFSLFVQSPRFWAVQNEDFSTNDADDNDNDNCSNINKNKQENNSQEIQTKKKQHQYDHKDDHKCTNLFVLLLEHL